MGIFSANDKRSRDVLSARSFCSVAMYNPIQMSLSPSL